MNLPEIPSLHSHFMFFLHSQLLAAVYEFIINRVLIPAYCIFFSLRFAVLPVLEWD